MFFEFPILKCNSHEIARCLNINDVYYYTIDSTFSAQSYHSKSSNNQSRCKMTWTINLVGSRLCVCVFYVKVDGRWTDSITTAWSVDNIDIILVMQKKTV